MNIKNIIFTLVSYWCASAAFSKSNGTVSECGKMLVPCQHYLKAGASTPPVSCCAPLTEMINDDVNCVCSALQNPDLLKKYNATRTGALNLIKACKIETDLTPCKEGKAAAEAPPPANRSNNKSPDKKPSKSAANVVACYGGISSSALYVASLVLAAM